MGERSAVESVDEPVTVPSLVEDLRDLGIRSGDTLLVHSSLSAIGWVCGDAPAVVDALWEAVTESGTLVMPTHTTQYSNPAVWSDPPVPDDWVETIRERRPPYRPAVTPTRGMGAVPECFRNYPGVVRSRHPIYSFAARGAEAEAIVGDHEFDYGLGEGSPLARVYDRDGDVLMLGTGYDTNTSLHLAEYRAEFPKARATNVAPILRESERVQLEINDIETSADDFTDLGAAFEDDVPAAVTEGLVGAAESRLIDQRALVDFAVEFFENHR
ncbi:aminoglycoside N(3)-acetyltransferase [Halovivax sp.]|uniref:aminoglycoside N(3)-acetyltransferase n=1 Tax=Halovivax sp. TaxID=1935978 RepID=UPI0025BECF18|nr:AAC(3) family N-acetyltransferase [Halovivax sp.]